MAIVNEVDVWQIALDAAAPDDVLSRLLSDVERERIARFHFERDRRAYAASHAALRRILAGYVGGGDPAAIEFTASANGKPALLNPLGVSFNLSHSGDVAMVAVARGREVGIDVERIRSEIDYTAIARRFFHPNEAAGLGEAGAFFTLWTRKEALVKARGLTLDAGLRLSEAPGFTVRSIDAPSGYAAAVAAEGDGWAVARFEFSDKTSRQ
jgi:4'-phosphopantetheinyl transferase